MLDCKSKKKDIVLSNLGNQLGEDGIREIRDAVEDLGLSTKDILDSMSDDEGEESDEEEEKENDDVNAKDPNLNTSSALPQVKKVRLHVSCSR